MERLTDAPGMLEHLMCPAFAVRDGIIIQANQAAIQRQILPDARISDLISIGAEEYARYTAGRLCLCLCVCDVTYNASVCSVDNLHIFCLDSDYEEPELRAFALAAQQLREPLTNAIAGTDLLLPNPSLQADPAALQQLTQVNRSLYQLLRAVCNMSDAAQYKKQYTKQMETRDITGMFDEILKKASHMISQSQHNLQYKGLRNALYCLVDSEKLERAILNLISNAAKYTPAGGRIKATLTQCSKQLLFTVENDVQSSHPPLHGDVFSRFLREPGIEDGRNGIGLGLTIVRSAAAVHGGTVLIEQPKESGVRFTMTIAIRESDSTVVRSPIRLPMDYAGGLDHSLLELSDILPNSLYGENI